MSGEGARPLSLLLVEDSDDDALMLLRALGRTGWNVTSRRVETGPELRAALDDGPFDVVISDHRLPTFDSLSALAILRASDADLPFIIVSGAIGEEAAVEAMAAGASDYVMKDKLARLSPAIERELGEAELRAGRREADRELSRLAAIVESSYDAIISKTLDLTVTSWNPAAERMYGYGAGEMIGRSILTIVPSDRREEVERLAAQVLDGERVSEFETQRLTRDGRLIDVSITLSPIVDADGTVVGTSTIARNITERKRFDAQLRHVAEHDSLTGLLNRRRFEYELERAMSYHARYGEPVSVLLLDLDNFKYVNDSLGHSAGDQLIRTVARAISERLRESDVLARLGGDEFAVILPRADAERACAVAEQLLEEIRRFRAPGGGERLRVSASIGVAPLDDAASGEDALRRADLAMYEVKDRGRNGVAVYSDAGGRRLATRIGWEERIRDALERDRFILHFQPIVDLADPTVVQGEVLLRMEDDSGRLVEPADFLPVAERSGLVTEIDRWVIRTAVRSMITGQPLARADRIAVNVSGRSLDDPGLPGYIEATLLDEGIAPSRLVLEVTETAAIANMDDAARFAGRLRDAGCAFALDDFGTGFGSFYYLKHLPLDYIKLDGHFIRDLPDAPTDQVMVRAMVEVAGALGLRTIAECVEDEATLALLREYGVDCVQGWHTGKPRPLSYGGRRRSAARARSSL